MGARKGRCLENHNNILSYSLKKRFGYKVNRGDFATNMSPMSPQLDTQSPFQARFWSHLAHLVLRTRYRGCRTIVGCESHIFFM